MKNRILFLVLIFVSSFAISQNWTQVGLGVYDYGVFKLYSDTTNNLLYASGNFKTTGIDTIKGIAKWNGVAWDSIGSGLNSPMEDVTFYNGELYAGGGFTKAGGITTKRIAKWNGVKWDSVGHGVGNFIFSLHVYNNELYVGGMFGYADTTTSMSIAKINGNVWHSVGSPAWTLVQVKAIQDYNGEIYAGGIFDATSPNILRWNGSSWNPVGTGIQGLSISPQVNVMTVYNGLLYIAGNFKKNDGNAGNYIMKWDGNNYSDVGGGLDGEVKDLVVFNNMLYAVGTFNFAGGIAAKNIAKWDGANWCGLGSTFNGVINSVEVYNNELYVGGAFSQIDASNINYVAKWIGGSFVSSCGNSIGILELSAQHDEIYIYPNPTINTLQILDNQTNLKNSIIEIKNPLGQLVLSTVFSNQIDISCLSSGMYFLTVQDNSNKRTVKIIKQ